VLSFIPGTVIGRWRRFPDADIEAVAVMLRNLHDASRGLVATAAGFSRELAGTYAGPDAVVCHHDPGPNNVVFDGGVPVAFIDFDFAAPGHRLEDVGYLAWSWCISSRPDRGPAAQQGRQLGILANAYGLSGTERHRLVPAVAARLRRNLTFWRRRLHQPCTSQGAEPHEVIAWTRRELAYVTTHRDALSGPLRT
jgi:Ser/Thr protein kinase RdoA (MazF antagonist)